MRVFLMHRDRDFAVRPELRDATHEALRSANPFALRTARRARAADAGPTRADVTARDLELGTLWDAMAAGDEFLFETARRALLSSLGDAAEIEYRQAVLADCLAQPAVVRELYDLAVTALGDEREAHWLWRPDRPDTTLHRGVRVLTLHLEALRRLRRIADEHARAFRSDGLRRFFEMVARELDDDYLDSVACHLCELEFPRGVLARVELAPGNIGRNHTVRRQREPRWAERLRLAGRSRSHSFTVPGRDEAGLQALEELRGRAINHVADAVARSAEHITGLFIALRLELAFYVGCVNLHGRLAGKGEPTCFPTPLGPDAAGLDAAGLYDPCLSLHMGDRVVGNDVAADGRALVLVTGANQGGKSTLLRSVGVAQLMLQSGMFVAARAFRAGVRDGVFTHYKREEDAAMERGKLDEELGRMSAIADEIGPGALLLCNESFASTNEREGSEIARQVIRALRAKGIEVWFVTHLYDLARGLREQRLEDALFLRAERGADGRRTFRVCPGEPLPTSHGQDSYRRIFGGRAAVPAAL
jgi:MutS domain V